MKGFKEMWKCLGVLGILLISLASHVRAQPGLEPSKRLEIMSTRVLQFGKFVDENGDSVQIRKLIGNVKLRQDTTDLECDSAYQYMDSNYVVAMGHVKITLNRTRTIKGDRLTYDGQTKILHLYDNITMQDSSIRLTTHRLTYYRNEGYGEYLNGGTLVTGDNTLTSKRGFYYPGEKKAYFRENVLLVNPDYTLRTDTLGYQTDAEIAEFLAPTWVDDSINSMYTEAGYYDTANDFAFLHKNAQVGDTTYILYADTIQYDQRGDLGKAIGNIQMQQLDSSVTIYGQYGEFRSKSESSFVTDSAFAIQFMDEDTLYLFADTLATSKDTTFDKKFFRAYNNTSFFMNDMQGIADSVSYWYDDSLLFFYKDPVLWTDVNQITGDTIMVGIKDDQIDTMSIPSKPFLIAKEDSVGFNQLKGKNLQAKFLNNYLEKMWIRGNSESIYFSKNDEKNEYIGMNQAKCTDMYIMFEGNKPIMILFEDQPEGEFFPMHSIFDKENTLEGFTWREEERPIRPEWIWAAMARAERVEDTLALRLDSVQTALDSLSLLLDQVVFDTLPPAAVDSGLLQIKSLRDSLLTVDSTQVDSALADSSGGKGILAQKGGTTENGKATKYRRSLKERWALFKERMTNPETRMLYKMEKESRRVQRRINRRLEHERKKRLRKKLRKARSLRESMKPKERIFMTPREF